MLLEDAEDLTTWLVSLKRTVPSSWCPDIVAAANAAEMEGFF